MAARVMAEIIRPTVAAMKRRGTPFSGVLYAGLMITETGPKLIEYNARFGDPECEVLMPRLLRRPSRRPHRDGRRPRWLARFAAGAKRPR